MKLWLDLICRKRLVLVLNKSDLLRLDPSWRSYTKTRLECDLGELCKSLDIDGWYMTSTSLEDEEFLGSIDEAFLGVIRDSQGARTLDSMSRGSKSIHSRSVISTPPPRNKRAIRADDSITSSEA
jgi:hypothetical protein